MARAVRVLVLLLVLGPATGISLADLVGADDCDVSCEDAATGKACPPACATCSCALRVTPMIASRSTAVVAIPLISRLEAPSPQARPAAPDPREILHVPRSHVV